MHEQLDTSRIQGFTSKLNWSDSIDDLKLLSIINKAPIRNTSFWDTGLTNIKVEVVNEALNEESSFDQS